MRYTASPTTAGLETARLDHQAAPDATPLTTRSMQAAPRVNLGPVRRASFAAALALTAASAAPAADVDQPASRQEQPAAVAPAPAGATMSAAERVAVIRAKAGVAQMAKPGDGGTLWADMMTKPDGGADYMRYKVPQHAATTSLDKTKGGMVVIPEAARAPGAILVMVHQDADGVGNLRTVASGGAPTNRMEFTPSGIDPATNRHADAAITAYALSPSQQRVLDATLGGDGALAKTVQAWSSRQAGAASSPADRAAMNDVIHAISGVANDSKLAGDAAGQGFLLQMR